VGSTSSYASRCIFPARHACERRRASAGGAASVRVKCCAESLRERRMHTMRVHRSTSATLQRSPLIPKRVHAPICSSTGRAPVSTARCSPRGSCFLKVSRCAGAVCTRRRVATMVDQAALELPIVPNECAHPSLRSSGSVRGRPTAITRS